MRLHGTSSSRHLQKAQTFLRAEYEHEFATFKAHVTNIRERRWQDILDAAFGRLVDNDDDDDDDVLEAGEMSMLSAYHNDIYEASSPIKR